MHACGRRRLRTHLLPELTRTLYRPRDLGAPAPVELLPDAPGTFGILFGASPKAGAIGKPAAQLVVQPATKEKRREGTNSRARAGSGPT